jgi:hypothetical protein
MSPGDPKPKGNIRLVSDLPATRVLHDKHLEQLKASGLTEETVALAELYTEGDYRRLAELVNRKSWPRTCGPALVFPFFLPGSDQPIAYRVKPTTPRVDNRARKPRVIKYDQAEDAGMLVYLPPRSRKGGWLGSLGSPLYWTEGEKKALCLDQMGLATIGLTGVWNYTDAKHKLDTNEERLHPVIREHVMVHGRIHVIVFDADARSNQNVMMAAERLAGLLKFAGAGSVKFVCPPSVDHKGIDDHYVAFGEVATSELLATATELDGIDPQEPLSKVRTFKALRTAPVADDMRVPVDYDVHKDGSLWKAATDSKHGDTKVATRAILIQRYLNDHYSGEGRADVCFERDGRWATMCVSLRALADNRTMVAELAGQGAPVTSNNASKLIDWFEDLDRANVGKIPQVPSVARAGWHMVNRERVFVLDEALGVDEAATILLDTRGDRRKIFGAMKPKGTLEEHTKWLSKAFAADPVCAAMICGALAAPLLEPLASNNFALHLPGDSSRGKTSMLKIAASVFGDPHSEQWVANWNTTAVAAELRAAVLTDLPQCYDEVGAADAQTIERMVYMLIGGGGRSRGQRDLTMRETPSWRTVVLSTGERGLAEDDTATGAQVRVVQLPVSGFGKLSGSEIDELREACAAHAGNFGREYIKWLLGIEDWDPFRAAFARRIQKLRLEVKTPLQGRIANYFALLAMAEALAAQIGLGDENGLTMHQLFRACDRREDVRGLAERSLELVCDWVMAQPDAFPFLIPDTSGIDEPKAKRTHVIHGFRKNEGRTLYLIPAQLRGLLDQHRLSTTSVVREWASKGWLQSDDKRYGKIVRIGGRGTRVYALNIEDGGLGLR